MSNMINLDSTDFESYKISFLHFDDDEPIRVLVRGRIANSIDKSERTRPWKQKIAQAIMNKRKGVQDPEILYAVSITMQFHPATHGNLKLDAENYIKPILDATAAGLFADENTNPSEITKFTYDDSNFENVYFDRRWADSFSDELIIITVSKTDKNEQRLLDDTSLGI